MHSGNELPVVGKDMRMREVLMEMTSKRLGVACVVDADKRLKGIITDGDLRRLLERESNPLDVIANEVMTLDPTHTSKDTLSAKALHVMESHAITSLPVLDDSGILIGLIHMHDILKLETTR